MTTTTTTMTTPTTATTPTFSRSMLAASWRSWFSNDNRNRVGPPWLQWVWTVLFCAGLAVPFTVLGFMAFARGEGAWRNWEGWLFWYGRNFIVSLTIGVVIHLLFDLARQWFATPARMQAWRPWQRTLFFSGVPMTGVLLGWPLGVFLAGNDVTVWIGSREGNNLIVGSVLVSVMLTFLFHQFFAAKAQQIEAEKRATEAQLRLLQAQIEPHFLFNTLANVLSLIDHDTPKAKQMLHAFTEYLRSSLAGLRHDQSPLGQELELAEHYLRLQCARMEDRLAFSIDADDAVRHLPLPPLLLQPLVENAVHHGLEPTIDGGQVQVRAFAQGGQLVIEVQDDGRGLDAAPRHAGRPARAAGAARPGSGLALVNIRQRLLARYGDSASLTVSAAQQRGTLARIVLPLDAAAAPT